MPRYRRWPHLAWRGAPSTGGPWRTGGRLWRGTGSGTARRCWRPWGANGAAGAGGGRRGRWRGWRWGRMWGRGRWTGGGRGRVLRCARRVSCRGPCSAGSAACCVYETHPGLMAFAGGEAARPRRCPPPAAASERVSKASPAPRPANHAVAVPVCSPVRGPVPIPVRARRAPPRAGRGVDREALARRLRRSAGLVLEGRAAERDRARGGRPERGRVGVRRVVRE